MGPRKKSRAAVNSTFISWSHQARTMTSIPNRRLQSSSEQLSVPAPDPGTYENIPKIREIAPNCAGQYVRTLLLPAL